MILTKGILIALSDGKDYIVISTMMLNDITYIYLMEKKNLNNMKFCSVVIDNDNIKLMEVSDLKLRQKLLKKFVLCL